MGEVAGVSGAMAFLAGVVSFLSPCVLPLVPGYVAYVAGESLDDLRAETSARARASAVGLGLCFVFGFSVVFIALGASASALGRLLLAYRYEANIVAGAIVILFGLVLTGLLRLPGMNREFRFTTRMAGGRPTGAFVLGTAFAFGWTPCIGPVLGAILAVGATAASVGQGAALLAIYAAGLAVPFLLVALFTGGFMSRLPRLRRLGPTLQVVAGGLMIVMGIAMITGYLSSFGFWLLDSFPVLNTVLL